MPISLGHHEPSGADARHPTDACAAQQPPAEGEANKPRASYGPLIAAYAVVATICAGLVRWRDRPLPRPSAGDVILIGTAVFRLSRLVTKDKVLQPLRQPFVESAGPGAAGEVNSQPAGSGVRRALGELLTCPFCTSMWLATVAVTFFASFPRAARLVAAVPASVALSDLAQYVLSAARKVADSQSPSFSPGPR